MTKFNDRQTYIVNEIISIAKGLGLDLIEIGANGIEFKWIKNKEIHNIYVYYDALADRTRTQIRDYLAFRQIIWK